MDADQIKKQAKEIMDSFAEAMKDVDPKEDEGVDREHSMRTPEECELTEGFSERMLKNAPSKKGKFIAAEKKKW